MRSTTCICSEGVFVEEERVHGSKKIILALCSVSKFLEDSIIAKLYFAVVNDMATEVILPNHFQPFNLSTF